MCLKDPDRLANSVDPDQTAPLRSSLIWVCTVHSDLYVPIFSVSDVKELMRLSMSPLLFPSFDVFSI